MSPFFANALSYRLTSQMPGQDTNAIFASDGHDWIVHTLLLSATASPIESRLYDDPFRFLVQSRGFNKGRLIKATSFSDLMHWTNERHRRASTHRLQSKHRAPVKDRLAILQELPIFIVTASYNNSKTSKGKYLRPLFNVSR